MNGPEGARVGVATQLAAHLAAKLTELEGRYTLAAEALPPPKKITTPRDPRRLIAIDQFPAIMVIANDTLRLERTDVDPDGARRYRARYRCRTFVYVRAEDEDAATTLRDRYLLAVREILLARPTIMGGAGVIDETTWRESMSETAPADQTRQIAAAYAELEVAVDERLADPDGSYTPAGGQWTTEVPVAVLDPAPPPWAPPGDLLPVYTITVDRP